MADHRNIQNNVIVLCSLHQCEINVCQFSLGERSSVLTADINANSSGQFRLKALSHQMQPNQYLYVRDCRYFNQFQ